MRRFFLIVLICFTAIKFCASQTPSIQWQKCYGGSEFEVANSIKQTADGGFIFAGNTGSNDGDVSGFHNAFYTDYWAAKIDSTGILQWQKCYGGYSEELLGNIELTVGNGFIISGTTSSNDGDVAGSHGGSEYWTIYCDSLGNIEWQKCYGGSDDDYYSTISADLIGKYLIVGASLSTDFDVVGSHNNSTCFSCADAWFIKIDSTGAINLSKCYGGSWGDGGNRIIPTNDSCYLIAAVTRSNDGDVQGYHGPPNGDLDNLILKIDTSGNILWQKCFGGTWDENPFDIITTLDGGYMTIGSARSLDFDVTGNHGWEDVWVVKLDSQGNLEWQKSLGGSGHDFGTKAIQLADSGYAILGYTNSNDGDVMGNHSLWSDIWLLKLDKLGNIEWQKCFGGSSEEQAFDMQQTADGGLIFCGTAHSVDGDVTSLNHGNFDVWIVKLSPLSTNIQFETNNLSDLVLAYVNNEINLSFYSDKNDFLNIELVDVSGKALRSKQFSISEGFNQFRWNENISGGMYFVRLTTYAGSIAKKFVSVAY